MPMQKYICIAESLYEDKDSWLAWGRKFMDASSVGAASRFIEGYPEESGVVGYGWEEEEPVSVLVKNADTGEIVRVIAETESHIAVTEAVVDKSFTSPKE